MARSTQCPSVIALAIGTVVACGGQVSQRSGEPDRPDSGSTAGSTGTGGSPSDASAGGSGGDSPVGAPCTTDADCASSRLMLVCELGRCQTPGSVVYPTDPALPLSTTFPTTCFAADLGLLEIRLAPPAGRSGFGQAVALDGDRLAVGTGLDGVQTYRGDGLTWSEEMFVALPEPEGESVHLMAMSGDTLVVGSPSNSEAGNQAGAAYVFHLGAGAATLERKLLPNPPGADLRFGTSVALDGETAAVVSKSTVVLFDRGTGSWSESQRLVPGIPAQADPFSVYLSVALRGDVLAVGASWLIPNTNSNGSSAVFLYRRTAGVFDTDSRIDPDPPSPSGVVPALGDGLIVVGANPLSVYSSGGAGWTLEAQLGGGSSIEAAMDGTRILVSTGETVQLFEQSGSTWPLIQTIMPHDVAAVGLPVYGLVALLGDVFAVGAPGTGGNGVGAGAVYTYVKATASSSPDCASSANGPARIEGAGTGCVEPGSGVALCPYVPAGTSTVAGMTPFGAIAFPFAWTDFADGFSPSTTLELSSVAPRRQGTSPRLAFTLSGFSDVPPIGQPMPTSFDLELCTRSVTVDGVIQFDVALDGAGNAVPLSGSIVIDHDGWAVKGSFHTDTLCAGFSSGP